MDEKETIFHTLYQEYHGVLYKTCISFTGNPAKADETVQEAFVRLWIVWDSRLDCSKSANKSWLYKTAVNILHEAQRADMRCPDNMNDLAGIPDEDIIGAREEGFQHEYYIFEIRKILKPAEDRVFDLYAVKGMTYREMAAVLNKSESTIRSQVSRMRKKLRPTVEKLLKEQ